MLSVYCEQNMLPYFNAAGHWAYARYMTYHIIEVTAGLLREALEMYMSGDLLSCKHKQGLFNAVFADQYGEQTYIRYGKAKRGLKGITLNEEQVATWLMSYHLCNMVSLVMDDMFDEEDGEHKNHKHKDEGKKRISLDREDRKLISEELKKLQNPLTSTSPHLINIYTGCQCCAAINND